MPSIESQKQKMRTKQAGPYVGLSASTLEKLRVYGGGPRYAKLGRVVIYDVTDLDAWVAMNSRTSTSDPGEQRQPGHHHKPPFLADEPAAP